MMSIQLIAYTMVICSVFIMLRVFVFYQKRNVRAFTIILGVTMKAVAFESQPEINGFVEKLLTFFLDLILLENKEICYMVDVASTFDPLIEAKENDKVKNYTEIFKMQKNEVTKVYIAPIVIGALGTVSKNISRYLETIGFDRSKKLQKACQNFTESS